MVAICLKSNFKKRAIFNANERTLLLYLKAIFTEQLYNMSPLFLCSMFLFNLFFFSCCYFYCSIILIAFIALILYVVFYCLLSCIRCCPFIASVNTLFLPLDFYVRPCHVWPDCLTSVRNSTLVLSKHFVSFAFKGAR